MNNFNTSSLTEYSGISSSKYINPIIIEKEILIPSNGMVTNVIRAYSNIEVISTFTNNSPKGTSIDNLTYVNGIYFCLCNTTLKIEYICDDYLNVHLSNMYIPLSFPIDEYINKNSINPKISNLLLQPISYNRIYCGISFVPY